MVRDHYETLAICRTFALARAAFAAAIAEKPAGRFTIRQRIRVVKRHPEGDWRAAIPFAGGPDVVPLLRGGRLRERNEAQ
jgi:hypothetical protein